MTFEKLLDAYEKESKCAKEHCLKEYKAFTPGTYSAKIQNDFNICKIQKCLIDVKKRMEIHKEEMRVGSIEIAKKLSAIKGDRGKTLERKFYTGSLRGNKKLTASIEKLLKK